MTDPMTPDQFAEWVADAVEPFIKARIAAEVNAALDKVAAVLRDIVDNCDGDSCPRAFTAAEALLADIEARLKP